jgi:hypothetical protein
LPIVGGRLAGRTRYDRVEPDLESQRIFIRNVDVAIGRHVVEGFSTQRFVSVGDDQWNRGVAAPVHRYAVLPNVVDADAPGSPEQVEPDRGLPGDDSPIAAFRNHSRSAELEASIGTPCDDVDDAADGIRAILRGCAARQHLDALDERHRQRVEIDRGVGAQSAARQATAVEQDDGRQVVQEHANRSVSCHPTAARLSGAWSVDAGVQRRARTHRQRLQHITDRTLAAPLDVAAVKHGDGRHGVRGIQLPARTDDDHFLERFGRRLQSGRGDGCIDAARLPDAAWPGKDPDRPVVQELEMQPGTRQHPLQRIRCR